MNSDLLTISSLRDRVASLKHNSFLAFAGYISAVCLLTGNVLWKYWQRDLTFGDTSSYFMDAFRWHLNGEVNIVWSPLYTVYFGSWLNISENANVATFLHRIGLILASTGLIAWLGYITLPRILSILLVLWWIALPIHYDTLYEVHLFGALPLLTMALVSMLATDKWRWPLLLGIAVVSTFLIRNEYIIVVGIFMVLRTFQLLRTKRLITSTTIRQDGVRYGAVLVVSIILVTYFYSISFIKGERISEVSTPKHTLNMCQVYAFGYQQRHTDWSGNPWTECSDLMKIKFDESMPTLGAMVLSNPKEAMEHFAWNLSLTRAGIEVLLFNATSANNNPDYAPVLVAPMLPTLLLVLTLMTCVSGTFLIYHKSPVQYASIRDKITKMSPLLLSVVVLSLAVIITQRPRPSYLLGLGVLYIWLVAITISAFLIRFKKLVSLWLYIFAALSILMMPTYRSLPLPSKTGSLGLIYNELLPHAHQLCQGTGMLAVGQYFIEINGYLCAKYRFVSHNWRNNVMPLDTLPAGAMSSPESLVGALGSAGVGALVIDPLLTQKYPGLNGCRGLHDVLVGYGWSQLAFSSMDGGRCIAAYVR